MDETDEISIELKEYIQTEILNQLSNVVNNSILPKYESVPINGNKIEFTNVPKDGVIFGGIVEIEYEAFDLNVTDRVTVRLDPDDETGKSFIINDNDTMEYDGLMCTGTYLYYNSENTEDICYKCPQCSFLNNKHDKHCKYYIPYTF